MRGGVLRRAVLVSHEGVRCCCRRAVLVSHEGVRCCCRRAADLRQGVALETARGAGQDSDEFRFGSDSD